MEHFCFFCVTYEKDYDEFKLMIESFKKHNVENIPFVVAIQDKALQKNLSDASVESNLDSKDLLAGGGNLQNNHTNQTNHSLESSLTDEILSRFKIFEDDNVKIILDTSFAKSYLIRQKSKILPFSIGYINQEIAKLTFFESGLYEHYLCIDSDSLFIRDFRKSDFFYDENTPYISLMQDKELHSSPHYKCFAAPRKEYIKKIFDFLDLKDIRYRTCHNSQIISSIVMQSFKENILEKKKLTYLDLLEIAPLEFSWYSAYFQKCALIKEVAIEGFFKMYHTKVQYLLDKISGAKIQDFKEEYIGVILQSNWAKNGFKKAGLIDRILFLLLLRLC